MGRRRRVAEVAAEGCSEERVVLCPPARRIFSCDLFALLVVPAAATVAFTDCRSNPAQYTRASWVASSSLLPALAAPILPGTETSFVPGTRASAFPLVALLLCKQVGLS